MRRVLSRSDLYALVWQSPTSVVAKELGVSDVLLGRICRHANVPIPDRGYWAKRRAGKPVLQPRLPPRAFGQHEDIEFGRGHGASISDSELLAKPLPPSSAFEGDIQTVRSQADAMVLKVPIPKSLADCHREIAKVLKADEVRRSKLLESPYATWLAPLFESKIERRRLRILNALFTWANKNGFTSAVGDRSARRAAICVNDQSVSFSLDKLGAKDVDYRDEAPKIPEGAKLCLKILWWEPPSEVRLEWHDEGDFLLEDQLVSIAREILFAAEWGYRSWKIRSHKMLLERRAEVEAAELARQAAARRQEEERLSGLLEARREALWAEAAAWRRAHDLRAYVAAVLERDPQQTAWAAWASAEADLMDPLNSAAATH